MSVKCTITKVFLSWKMNPVLNKMSFQRSFKDLGVHIEIQEIQLDPSAEFP